MKFAELSPAMREKALQDVFCAHCQKACSLDSFSELEFKGMIVLQGKCPDCGGAVVKSLRPLP